MEGWGRCGGKGKFLESNIKILNIRLLNEDSCKYLFSLSKGTVTKFTETESRLEVSMGWGEGEE